MSQDNSSVKTLIATLIEMLQQEINGLQIVGRALTTDETKHIETLRQTITQLQKILNPSAEESVQTGAGSPAMDTTGIILRDGRYTAVNPHLQADLRLDAKEHGIFSVDFYRSSIASGPYLASLRSNPGAVVKAGQRRIAVIGQDDDGNQATGFVDIIPHSDTQATVTVNLERGLNSLPVSVPVILTAAWQSPYFRTIGLEVDFEQGNEEMPTFLFENRNITIESCFGEAGLEIIPAGQRNTIPQKIQGWTDAELHALMSSFANESLERQAWLLHLMILSKSETNGLLGVMFDSGRLDINGLPRQGVAVFTDAIRTHPAGFKRKMIQTITHELGHALNLAHRFERVVSRADSLSCMNYDWRYLGGNRQSQFWRDFRFGFDADEIRFLRHSPRTALIPGGAEFHTVNYWADGTGGYSPYYREEAFEALELKLHTPPSGMLFSFAQPIILMVELFNRSGRALEIPPQLLDPKSGFLEILVRRLGAPTGGANQQFSFSPLVNRCWTLQDSGTADRVENDRSMKNNINLTFGSAGFTFADPGDYEITAILSLVDQNTEIDRIVRSNPIRIRIAHPQSLNEERDAMDIFQKDVGFYLALGGSDQMTKEEGILKEICERRESEGADDPLVAHVKRVEAINNSRDFTIYDKDSGKFSIRESKPEESIKLLTEIEDNSQQFFDSATKEGLSNLKSKMQAQIQNTE